MIFQAPTLPEVTFVCQNLRPKSRDELAGVVSVTPEVFAQQLHGREGFHWVGYCEGFPAALIGAYPQRRGVWSLYGLGTVAWGRIWREVTRVARRDMMQAVLATDCWRAECLSLASHEDTHRWLGLLGASHRAEMPQYGLNGQDYILFSWLRGNGDVRTEG